MSYQDDDDNEEMECVNRCNELARQFYKMHGYEVPEAYRFDQATHPQELGMWNLAAAAYYWIDGTDVQEILRNLKDDESDGDDDDE